MSDASPSEFDDLDPAEDADALDATPEVASEADEDTLHEALSGMKNVPESEDAFLEDFADEIAPEEGEVAGLRTPATHPGGASTNGWSHVAHRAAHAILRGCGQAARGAGSIAWPGRDGAEHARAEREALALAADPSETDDGRTGYLGASRRFAAAGIREADELIRWLAHRAAAAQRSDQAERLLAAATAGALQLEPRVYRLLWPLLPLLLEGTAGLARFLHRRRATRPLLRLAPDILARTVNTLAKLAVDEAPIRRRTAARVLARTADRTIRSCTHAHHSGLHDTRGRAKRR